MTAAGIKPFLNKNMQNFVKVAANVWTYHFKPLLGFIHSIHSKSFESRPTLMASNPILSIHFIPLNVPLPRSQISLLRIHQTDRKQCDVFSAKVIFSHLGCRVALEVDQPLNCQKPTGQQDPTTFEFSSVHYTSGSPSCPIIRTH